MLMGFFFFYILVVCTLSECNRGVDSDTVVDFDFQDVK